jgi:hypothetical protein
MGQHQSQDNRVLQVNSHYRHPTNRNNPESPFQIDLDSPDPRLIRTRHLQRLLCGQQLPPVRCDQQHPKGFARKSHFSRNDHLCPQQV